MKNATMRRGREDLLPSYSRHERSKRGGGPFMEGDLEMFDLGRVEAVFPCKNFIQAGLCIFLVR